MDPVEPWIDSAAVKRMAAQLLAGAGELKVEEPAETEFGSGFEGFLDEERLGDGKSAPVLESEPVMAATPPPLPEELRGGPRGMLIKRLHRFRDWFNRQSGARGVFILDRDGQPVLDDPSFAKLHFLARSLAQAYRPNAGNAGNVHVKVGAEAYLVVIPVETVFGCLVLGAVLSQPLSAGAVEVVSKALSDAVRPGV